VKKTLKQKIDEIQNKGYEVEIEHLRPIKYIIDPESGAETQEIAPRGGQTRVKILKDEAIVSFADSFCSISDNYNRKIGALIALGRAEKKIDVCPECGGKIEGVGPVQWKYDDDPWRCSNKAFHQVEDLR
jgi:hypothetical protein